MTQWGGWNRLIFYRYEVAFPRRFAVVPNRYPGRAIGVAVVVGRWAYCLRWGSSGVRGRGWREMESHGWPDGMREVAAMALCRESPAELDLSWSSLPEAYKEPYYRAADAVLVAVTDHLRALIDSA